MKEKVIAYSNDDFINFLFNKRQLNQIRLFYDIETYQYNEKAGRVHPSDYKNCVFSVALSFEADTNTIGYIIYNNFKELIDAILTAFKGYSSTPKIILNAHNANKYDNHYLRHDLIYYYGLDVVNLYLRNAEKECNEKSLKIKSISEAKKKAGIILEKRVKSKNNLSMVIYIDGVRIDTEDNFLKTNTSLRILGKKLNDLDLIDSGYLKTDFNYTKYNKDKDLSETASKKYARQIFNNLDKGQITYIRNDVIILVLAYKYYSVIFNGFDYSRITFTQNILDSYNDNQLTNYQLLHKVQVGKTTQHVKYTDYSFDGVNLYDYLRPFYSGGLNFYNDKYLGKIINEPCFTIDLNSSYPYVMEKFKIPTFLHDYRSFEKPTLINIDLNNDYYYLYRMTKQDFDDIIIKRLDSRILKQILVKYYSKMNGYININSYTIRTINNISNLNIQAIPVKSWISFKCLRFASRDKISDYYFKKQQGKLDKKLIYKDPYNMYISDKKNKHKLTAQEVAMSKVNLNGIYGVPALRPYYNLFRLENGQYVNYRNGFNNSERNIVFSIFVTSVAFYNLLNPLSYLTAKEIDDCFIYTDTDSLYMKKKILHKLPSDLFDPLKLGSWGFDDKNISSIYVLNHKKYCYKNSEGKIVVKSAGIPLNSYNKDMDFKKFIKTQFKPGTRVKNTRSILNNQGTVSIYTAYTTIELGSKYPTKAYDEKKELEKIFILYDIKKTINNLDDLGDLLYIETPYGALSFTDVYKKEQPSAKPGLDFFKIKENHLKPYILDV